MLIPRPRCWAASIFVFLFVAICFDICRGQNIIAESSTFLAANPAKLTETDFSEFIAFCPDFRPVTNSPSAQRISRELESHIVQFLAGSPWMPFHQTLGISGYEVYFNHPDEMYYALSVALPMLSKSVADRTRRFLSAQLEKSPPYAVAGFDNRAGQPRESSTSRQDSESPGKATRPARSEFTLFGLTATTRQTTPFRTRIGPPSRCG